jgi:predicted deacylase
VTKVGCKDSILINLINLGGISMKVLKFLIWLFLVLNGDSVLAQIVKVGTIEAKEGEATSGYLIVPKGIDEGTRIPITLINGAKPGPVLALIAGTHGYEYAPIIALQNIKRDMDPKDLSGTLILVHVANMPSFLGRTIYYSPIDGKNLNRAYPGLENGSVSERIAFVITQNIIRQADYVVDMHSGDGNEALRPYIYMPKGGNEKFNKTIKDMAVAFGVDHIIIDQRKIPEFDMATFTDATALALGKPSMTTETGQMGSTSSEWTDIAEQGAWNLLRHFEMIEGENKEVSSIVWLENYEVITSPETGMFRPSVREGYAVAEGGKLGVLVDVFGEKIADIKAPFAGIVNYVIATPPISKGEPLAMVSQVKN